MSEPILFHGGPIRACDGSVASDTDLYQAVLVQDGRIAAVGDRATCTDAASSIPRVVDLEGRCLMPGFVDPHMHLLLHGSRLDWSDLSGARSVADVVQTLRRYADAHPDAPAVRGYGYDQSLLREGRHPTAAELDQVDAGRPVQIQHISGHGYVVNTRLLKEHGITADTPVPTGGRIDHDEAGEPNGLVFDAACDLLTGKGGVKVTNHGPNFHLPMTNAELRRLALLGQESFLAAGITTACDAQVTELELRTYLAARDDGVLRLRAHLLMLSSTLDHLQAIGLGSRIGDANLEISGVKFYADGSVLARTAYLGDHCCGGAHAGERRGYLYHEPKELVDLLVAAHYIGLTTATHAQGSFPIDLVLQAVEQAGHERPRPGLRHRIEHCGFPSDQQVARMRALGVVPVPQPLQVHERVDAIVDELGPEGGRFYPYGLFERAGVPVVISSDAPVTDPAPLRSVWAAVTRETASGRRAGGADLTASRGASLDGITRTAAGLLGRRDVGTIAPGRQADLVLLDGDPFTVPIEQVQRVGVTETWIAGAPVWSAGQLSDQAKEPA